MGKLIDLTGQRFGKLAALDGKQRLNGEVAWRCACDCGNETLVRSYLLRSGVTSSCGCLQRERSAAAAHRTAKHGGSASREYKSWRSMKQRCQVPADVGFKYYGGRGITVCERWQNSFAAFLSDMGPRPPRHTLDRWPDPNGNYEPTNCRWATPKEQARNRRSRARK